MTEYRVLSEADALQFCQPIASDTLTKEIRAAYGRGEVCVGALYRNHLVAWVWLQCASMPPRPADLPLSDKVERALAESLENYVRSHYPVAPLV